MKLMIPAVIGVFAVAASGLGYAAWSSTPVESAKRQVRESLVDPDSAKFSDLEKCYEGASLKYVTGSVNARNSMGGMTGKKRFIATPTASDSYIVHIENGSQWENPNLADKIVAARIQASSTPMSCDKVLTAAEDELYERKSINPDIPLMNATDEMDPVTEDAEMSAENMTP